MASPEVYSATVCSNPAIQDVLHHMRTSMSDLRAGEELNYAISSDLLPNFHGKYDIKLPPTNFKGTSHVTALYHLPEETHSGRPRLQLEGKSMFPGMEVLFTAQAETHNGKLLVPTYSEQKQRTNIVGRATEKVLAVATPMIVREFGVLAATVVNTGLGKIAKVEGFTIGKDSQEALVFALKRR